MPLHAQLDLHFTGVDYVRSGADVRAVGVDGRRAVGAVGRLVTEREGEQQGGYCHRGKS
ncbi:MAG TPA: hypothetical protein VFP91_00520 [Vicinamibacterales bacterium]|nr:hypothetical protein [Vicinamibacterales bacterium]